MDLEWWIKYPPCTSNVAIELCKAHASASVCPLCAKKRHIGEKSKAPEQTEHILPLGNFPTDRRIGSLELYLKRITKNTHGRSIWNQVGHISTERPSNENFWSTYESAEKPYAVVDFPLVNRKPLYQLFFTLIQIKMVCKLRGGFRKNGRPRGFHLFFTNL